MSKKVRGLTIAINGETKELKQSLNQANRDIKATKDEANALKQSLKLEWNNDTFIKAQKSAQEVIAKTEEKVIGVKEAIAKVNQSDTKEAKAKIELLSIELIKAENEAKKAHRSLSEINNTKFNNISKDIKEMDAALNNVIIAGTAYVGVIAALSTGVYKFAEYGANATDAIDKMSIRLGMSRQTYQELSFALSQYGIEITSMNTGMKTMTAAMASLAEEGKKGEETLGKLGVTIEDINNLSQEDIFLKAISSLQNMEMGYEKARLAQQLFGKQGQELLPLLNAQKGTLTELSEKANQYGIVLSDEIIDKGVALKDSIDLTTRKLDSLKVMISSGLFEGFSESAIDFADFLNTDEAESQVKNLGETLGKIAVVLVNLVKGVYDARGAIAAITSTIVVLKTALMVTSAISKFNKAIGETKLTTILATKAQAAYNAVAMANPYALLAVAIAAVTAAIVSYSFVTNSATNETQTLSQALKNTEDIYNQTIESLNSNILSKQADVELTDKLIDRYGELTSQTSLNADE